MERRILKASSGMILTDGETYGTTIYLGEDADETKFKEITLEEYNLLMESEYGEGYINEDDNSLGGNIS